MNVPAGTAQRYAVVFDARAIINKLLDKTRVIETHVESCHIEVDFCLSIV